MKNIILLTISLLFTGFCYSQNIFTFHYDESGNRIQRKIVTASPTNVTLESDDASELLTDNLDEDNSNLLENTTGDAFPTILYPNPTYGQFTLELPDFIPGEKGYIILYNAMGKVIINQKYVSATQHFDISNMLPGYYIVHIMVNDQLVIKKIIKQ